MARLAALLAASPRFAPNNSQFMQSSVAVEKGTKAVICVNFSACGKRRFNNLRANFVREIPRKEFFNTHRRCHKLAPSVRPSAGVLSVMAMLVRTLIG